MRTLRGIFKGTHVTIYILLPLALASILITTGSRSTYAESPTLLGTVRCAVRTLLWVECPATTPSTTQQAPASTPQPAPESQPAPTPATTSAPTKSAPAKVGGEEVAQPDQTIAPYSGIEQISSVAATSPRIQENEYVAYFNQYSPYAVAGAHDQQTAPIERTNEGWRLLGVAWYWWVAALLVAIMIFTSFKRLNLRKSSVLSGGQ